MTELIFDRERENDNDLWLTGRVVDETYFHLAKVKIVIKKENEEDVTVHKYYAQARQKMYLIPLGRPSVPFVIYITDLDNVRIKKELEEYYKNDKKTFEYILRTVAGKFFENLDFEYYHGSVMRNLRVKLE